MNGLRRPPLKLVADPDVTTTESEAFEPHAPRETMARPTLTIVHHPRWDLVGLRATVGRGGALLGRSASACLPGAFDVSKVSREHARVSVSDGRVVVADLGSRNGTRVNGEAVDKATLAPGDAIELGGVMLLYTVRPAGFAEPRHPRILGCSWPIAQILGDVSRVAESEHAVTLVGETGTGKELVAEAIHEGSGRSGALVAVNCGALAEGVLESELFGHVQGAFTGAASGREGLVAQAEGGTLFLDEVTSTPLRLQTVMLRLLENGTYRPVGGNQELQADVRVVAAAQPQILRSTEDGSFRPDLWFRLSRRMVELPPLRERLEDIPLLARHFAREVVPDAELTPALSLALLGAPWPGNVRQLRNVVERIAEASAQPLLSDTSKVPSSDPTTASASPERIRQRRPKRARPSRETMERVMDDAEGRIATAARRLGVDRKTVYRWLDAHGIERLDAQSKDE